MMGDSSNPWSDRSVNKAVRGRNSEHIGQAFLELAKKHGPRNVYPGAALNRAKLRSIDQRNRNGRLAKRRVPLSDAEQTSIAQSSAHDEPSTAAAAMERDLAVHQALQQLPGSLSQAVEYCTMRGIPASVLAARLGCTARTVQKRVKLAIQLLRSNKALREFASL